MKIKLKRQTEAPPNVKEAVSRISSTPFGDLGRALAGFRWAFDKGDINHWVPVLDHFDSFLEQYVSKRADVQLTGTVEGLVNESVFPTEVVLAVLSATCSILENCSNKGAYNSAEHLSSLLAAPGREVLTAALRVFQVLMRKTHHTSVRVAVPSGLTKRLLSLCRGWGGKEEGLDLAFCASSREATDNRVLRKATTLHFEFTPDKQPQGNGAAGSTAGVQPVTLHIPNMEKFSEPEHTILMELVQRFSIPATVRFDLLCRIRIARNFGTLAGRRQLIRQRLLAFNVLLQCSPSAEEYTTLYLAEPEIVNELVGLVQAEEAVEDEELRILALKALGAQLHDRSRSSNVITAVTSGGQSGLLAMLLHKSVSSILHQAQVPLAASGSGLPWHHAAAAAAAAAPQPERTHIGSSDAAVAATQPIAVAALAQSSMQYSVSFVDALLTLVAAMVTSSTGCQALNDAGVISALLPLLRDLHPDHLGIICTSLKILEMYMDLSQTASTTFRELGGLTEVIRRLATDVKSVADPAARPAEAATVGQGPEDVLMTAADQSVDQTTADMAYQAAQTSAKQLPHNRKTLLKILLRIITISSYQPTGNLTATRPVDDDAHMLYAALSAIYGHPEEFGGTLFSHAVSVMTDLIHHEPQSFRQLQEAGLPDAFLAAVKAAVFPTGDAIVSIPGALVALCLNSIGLKQVRETCALNVLVNVFTSKKVLRVLTGDTPSVLGSGLEELMRFVPSLRSDGVNVVLGVFRALCVLGGDDEEFEAASKPLPPDVLQGEAAPSSNITPQDAEVAASERRAASASASAQPMETDAAGPTAAHAVDVQPAEEEVLGSIQNTTTSLTAVNVPVDGSADGMDVDTHPGVAATLATAAVAPEQPSVVSRAVAVNSVGAQTAQQEREAERQRQQQDDERLSAIAGRALAESLQQVAARRDQDADVEAFLPLALTAASRMLEPLLANGETSRLFVERGGAELLLKLYKLPRLTTVFNFSSASHSLLSVFRALSGAHGTAIAAKSKETVAHQLAVLLPMAEEIGAVCVPTLPAEQRDLYTKQVLVVQGLVALTSAVARNVTAMLPQVSMGDPPLLATMGKLERIVMAQTAVSDPWKQARDAAKKVAAAAEAGGTSAIGADAPAEAAAEPVGADAGEGIEMEAVGAEEELVGTAGGQALARGGPDATTASTNSDVNANNRQKRAPEDISYDALNYLLTSLRTFYMGTAKAIHTPVRRREDPVTSPTAPMKAAALNLALLLVGNLQLRPWPQTQQQQCQWTNAEHAMVQAAAASAGIGEQTSSCYHQPLDVAVTTVRQCSGHFLRVSEELNQVLFDSRRHYCHLLVLNYFSALGGMQALASALSEASELLWSLLDLQAPPRSEGKAKEGASGDQLMADTGSGTEQAAQALPSEAQAAPTPASPAAAVAVPGAASTKDPKQVMEAVMVKLLAIYEQLANATILLSAPQATSMLLAALPNYAGQPLVPPPKDPLNFVQQLHSHILSAVLPLWNHPKAAYAPSGVLNSIVRVLMTSFQGPGPASIVLRYSQQGRPAAARVQAQPDPQMVQQIMEMGFSQARAEEALRRVGANSVELAMEWLISQPDEAAATAGAATAAAATAGTNAEGAGGSSAATVSEEEELTRALLASLSVVGMSPDAVAQQSQQQLLAEQATRGDDTAEGAPAEIEDIATTPQTTPRPLVQPGAPVLGAAAAAAAIVGSAVELPAIAPNAPAPSQLLDGALRLIGTSPSTAFLISDLLLTIAQREEGRDRGALLDQLIDKCLPPVSETGEVWEETQLRRADVLPPTRLLLLLLHKDVASRRVAAGKGLVVRCLKALEAWQHQYRLHVQAYESSSDKQHKELIKELEVPVWVEAFLMLLDIMATTSTESENTSRRAARATRAVHVPEGGAAPVEAVAAPVVAPGTAVPSTAQVDEEDMQTEDQPAATASTEAVVAGNQLPATRAATEATAKLPAELSQLSGLTEVLRNWRPCGALDHEQQQRATTVALTLLQHLHHFADKWDHPSASMFECDASMPNPGSVTTAVLQLLSHLTKRHSNAQQVLAAGGHQLLLSLPSACLAPSISRQETHIGSVLRHLLEDQITLESWMESEIKNSMSFKGARDSYMAGRAYHSNRNPLSRYATAGSFLTMMSSLVSREPAVFLQAVARTCALETVRGETMVRLKTAREQQQGHLPVIGNRDAPVVGEATGTPAIGASGRGRALPAEAAASPDALTATVGVAAMLDGASERHGHKVTAKSSKKLVPASFVEVVDALLDVVLSYNGLPSPHAQQHSQPDNVPAGDAAAMELDGASVPAPMQPAASGSQGLSSRHDAAPVPADLLLRQLNPVSREVGIQAMVLRLLADYCLLYNNTVGLLLKRDSEGGPADARSLQHDHQHAAPQQLSPAESSRTSARVKSSRHSSAGGSSSGGTGRLSTPGATASSLQEHRAGAVLKHIMHVQLVDATPEGAQAGNGVAANASALLQAVCIRSGEGRKRVLNELVAVLAGTESSSSSAAAETGRDASKLPYIHLPDGPNPFQVAACVDLMGALAQNSNSLGMARNDPRQQNTSTSMPLELLRAMREAGAIKALTHVITVINTDHNKAKDAINAVLKPLEVLTRPLPKAALAADGSLDAAPRGAQTRRQEQQTAPSVTAGDVAQLQPASGTAGGTQGTPGNAAATRQAQASAPAAAAGPAAAGETSGAAREGHTSARADAFAPRTATAEHQQQHDGEEAAGPDALAAAGRFVSGGAGQAPGQIPGALIDQLMDQLVDIEVELDAAGSEDDSAGGSSADVDDSDEVGSSDDDEDMADLREEADMQGQPADGATDEDDVVDAPSLTEEEGGTDDVGEHGAVVAAPGIGLAGHGMAEIDSSEDDRDDSAADDEDNEHGHHHQHDFGDAMLPDDDMHIMPPQLDGHHHPQEDGVVDPLDGEDEEEEDEYLDDDDDDDDQSDDENGLVDAAMADFLDGGAPSGWDAAPPGDLDDLPGFTMPGGFGRMTARRMAYRPTATAAAAGVWDDSEQGDAAQDVLGGVSTAQMLLSQLGLSASGDGGVSRFGPNGRQYRVSLLGPDSTASANTGTAGSEAVAGAMSSALYTLSTQLMPQQHRLLALPPRLPVSENVALLQSAAAVVPGASGSSSADAASVVHGQASSINALTRLLTRAPENGASTSYLRESGRARLVAQRQGGNLFSITLDSVGLPAALGPAANFLQSFELLQPGGMLGGPPGAGALADLDNSVWDEAVNQLLEALAPQGLGRSRAAPSAAAARAAGGQADEASIDPRSLESQLLTMLRAQAPNEPSQQQQQQQQEHPATTTNAAATGEAAAGAPPAQYAETAAVDDGSAPTGLAAGEAAPPASRSALTEETIAAALQLAMQSGPAPAASQDGVVAREQQQQAAAIPAVLSSHPVDIPSTAPESPNEAGAVRGADTADAALNQPTPMETEEIAPRTASASAEPLGTVTQDGGHDSQQQPPSMAAVASDMEVEGDTAVLEALRQAAEAAEIDLAFLEALPEELRVEVLSARGVELRLPQPTVALPQPELPAAPLAIPDSSAAAAAAAQSSAEEERWNVPTPAPAAPEATAGAEHAEGTTAVPAPDAAAADADADAAGPAAAAEEDAIDPEFLAALPEDIRQEVLAQQAAERRARAAAARATAQRQQELGLADLLAAMDEDARADALGQLSDSDLAQLPPAMRAQARALRERALRHQQALQHQQQAAAAVQQQQHDLLLRRAQLGASALNGLVPGAGGRLLMTLGPDGLPVSSRNRFGPLSAALGGSGMRSLSRAELLDAGSRAADESEGPPLLGDSELAVLVQLLQASLPLSKAHLQKLFLNVAGHSSSRKQLLKMLLMLLRSLHDSTDGTVVEDTSKSAVIDANTSEATTMQQSQQSLSTTLDMLGSAAVSSVSGPASAAPHTKLMSSATAGKPAVVGRRVLDMLVYLSRHSQRVACQMLSLPVDATYTGTGNEKSRGKLPATVAAAATPRGLEVLLDMLSAPLCQRSVSLLEQLTVLLEVILSVVQRFEADQQVLAAIKQARKKQEEEASGSQPRQQEQIQPTSTAAGGDGSQTDPQQPPTTTSPEAAATPSQPVYFQPAVQQHTRSDEPQQQQPEPQLASTLASIQPGLLQQLPRMLAQETLSESAYISIAKVVKLVVELAPIHLPMMLDVLIDGVAGVAQALLTLLDTVTDKGLDADVQPAPMIGVKSGVVLRMLYALQGFQAEIKRSKQSIEEQQQQQQQQQHNTDGQRQQQPPPEQATGVGSAAESTVNQGSLQDPPGQSSTAARAPSAAGPGSSTAASAVNRLDPETAVAELDKAVAAVATRTAPLWNSLSKCILRVEDSLRAVLPQYTQGAGESAGHAAARLLPPGAQQVLPLVEAFFVLCALQGTLPAAPTTGKDLLTAASAEPSLLTSAAPEAAAAGASGSLRRSPAAVHATPSARQLKRGASAALEGTGPSEGYMPFLQFAERHRRLLNAYIRRNSSLLESSLAPLLRVPKLIDFDNKRAYFKSKVRAQEDRAYTGGLRLAVKRSTVFEDSFNKLRSRTPAEMRGKLSVSFVGEEGIDAGGVSREWYQVMAREIFNPNLALFVSVPEGGTTFQPNPNSVVQSDTGVSHLEYFKFVGRLVGKALYDGQLMDAYFTRSFYKHMLGQPLTYEDIEAVDPEYYKNLKWMLENDITDVLDLTFTAESDFFGKTEVVELVPGGREVKVTEGNKHDYVNLIARHRMTTSIKPQIQAFLEGFWQLISRELISIFNDHELELLISGLPDIDVSDLRANTEYTGYTAASPVIQWFWQVVADMDKQDLALLLQFVTGTSKVPLGGFKTLQGISGPQRFQIHKSYGADRLPSAHTCFNQLDLPEYDSKEQLAERLAMAIHEGHEGFGFG